MPLLSSWERKQAEPLNPNLLFAGQYADDESGLAYNRFRCYDPQSVNYLASDPIGLNGGETPCAYVHNPMGLIEPFGLSKCKSLSNINKDGNIIHTATTKKGIQKTDRVFNNKNEAKNRASKQLDASKERIYDGKGK